MANQSNNPTGSDNELGAKARSRAEATKADLQTSAEDVKNKATAQVSRYADDAKDTAANEVKDVSSALRKAAEDLRDGSPQERTFSQLADGLADASEAMRNKDLGEMMSDLNSLARRNPLVFLGGAALVGFAATRFAKASRSGSSSTGQMPSDRSKGSGGLVAGRTDTKPAPGVDPVTTHGGTA